MVHIRIKRMVLLPVLLVTVPTFVGCFSSYQPGVGFNEEDRKDEEYQQRQLDHVDPAGKAAGRTCFDASMVESFDSLRPRYVYVNVAGEAHYLLTLAEDCVNLANAMNISIHSRFQQVCSHSEGSLIYSALGRSDHCRIANIQKVRDKAAAEALITRETAPEDH